MGLFKAAALAALAPKALAASCATDGTDYEYTESATTETRSITISHCPNHPWTALDSNDAIKEVKAYDIPSRPMFASISGTDSTIESAHEDLSERAGAIGLFFSGALVYSPYAGSTFGKTTGWSTSSPYLNGSTVDQCGCRSSSNTAASYHCTQPPVCLLQQLGQADNQLSPQIGWAFDGFPIYGPRGPGGIMMKKCSLSNSMTYGVDVCTDECGGYYDSAGTIDKFVYRYFMQGNYGKGDSCEYPACPGPTEDFFPTSPMCFRGCCPPGVTCTAGVTPCRGGSMMAGTTAGYFPDVQHDSGLLKNTVACKVEDLTCAETCTDQDWKDDTATCKAAAAGGTNWALIGGGGGGALLLVVVLVIFMNQEDTSANQENDEVEMQQPLPEEEAPAEEEDV